MADKPVNKAASPLDQLSSLFSFGGSKRVSPTETVGAPGTPIFSGYIVENEKDASLQAGEKYKTFSQILADTAIVAAGVRYFLNLAGGAKWTFVPAEDHPQGEEMAETAEKMLTKDPETSWPRIVRRAAMYRFYGFSVQEWTMMRGEDGMLTYKDISPRPQQTITRWETDENGAVTGIVQTNPKNFKDVYLPREKVVYCVDDTLNDSPEGIGLFRHIVNSVVRLKRYEQLEGFGFEGDLRGIPVGRAPYAELRQKVENGEITLAQANAAVAVIESFIKKHVKNPELGLLLDSEVFATLDESARPSSVPKFDLKLLEGSQNSLTEAGAAIDRLNHDIARVLGIEGILLSGGAGSYALAHDKTSQFSMTVDSTLTELADQFSKDLLVRLWEVNGFDPEAMPEMKVEAVQYKDIDQITRAIRDMAAAGAMLDPSDPIIQEVRSILGIEADYVPPAMGDDLDDSLLGDGSPAPDPMDDDETLEDIDQGDDE